MSLGFEMAMSNLYILLIYFPGVRTSWITRYLMDHLSKSV